MRLYFLNMMELDRETRTIKSIVPGKPDDKLCGFVSNGDLRRDGPMEILAKVEICEHSGGLEFSAWKTQEDGVTVRTSMSCISHNALFTPMTFVEDNVKACLVRAGYPADLDLIEVRYS